MLKTITLLLVASLCYSGVFANDYDDAWTAIRKRNFKEAKTLLQSAMHDPATAMDAYMTLLYLNTYEGSEIEIKGLETQIKKHPGRDAYLFATWFNGGILGQYRKKKDYQLDMVNGIIEDNVYNGSLKAAAHYVKAMHHIFSHDYDKANKEYLLTGAIQDWQLAGPFENLSGSGIHANHGPLSKPGADAKFQGLENIEVGWFTPLRLNREAWTFTYAHLPENSAVIYAQAFVESPEDMKVIINAGGNGAMKIWVNDGLVLSESKERVTELDYYKNHANLKKGFNRILVQLGYTGNSSPNFIVRITDNQFVAIKGLNISTSYQAYQKATDATNTKSIKHFAEEYFEKKIASEPSNLVNYILLGQAYLRDEKTTEARQVIEKGLSLSPENPLLKFELIQSLIKANNRTLMLQELDWIKENDPKSYLNMHMETQNLIKDEKFQEAADHLSQMVEMYGEDESTIESRIQILAKMEKIEEMLKLAESAFAKYPDNTDFLSMKFRIEKLLMKNPKSAVKVYEKYLKGNYNYSILTSLADEYKDQGQYDKYLDILEELHDNSGYDPRFVNMLSKYYFEKGNYKKALDYAKEALLLSPYTGKYWENQASIYEIMNNKTDAIASYQKAIYYDRTNYDARKKLAALEGKADLYKMLPANDAYQVIKSAPVNKDHDYTYLVDEKGVIIYDEGASEEYITYAVKINTEKGIDSWKEIYLSYGASQSLLVEKTEVVKANGSKVAAEREDDHVVFTGLEVGDAVYVKYRVQNYSSGRLGREFSDKFLFNSFAPSLLARYTLIAPKTFKFDSKVVNHSMKPVITERDGYQVYTWELKDAPAMKSEPLMPPVNDVGTVLHISTIKSWSDVAQWYSDLAHQDMSDNIELDNAYAEIFKDKKQRSDYEKARMIYDYIVTNIRYSSVSFRQSGLVPQAVSKTLSTRLGDCKDLSTLFVALAAKAGISAKLVLIDTRDNGVKDMMLPSMEFNHCISVANINNKDYYIELTDSHLPFGSLPNNLTGALSLQIPVLGQNSVNDIKPLSAPMRTADKINRQINVTVSGKDFRMNIVAKRKGALVSTWRESYGTLTEEKQKEEFEQTVSNSYKNPVKLESVSFKGLNDLGDSLVTTYAYTVKNEVIEAGSMKMMKVPFIDLIATLENVSADERKFPVEYWKYEDADQYETSVLVQLPANQKFIEIPTDVNYSFKGNAYTLKYIKDGEKLRIVRTAKVDRSNVEVSDYAALKQYFNQIVEAESRHLVFK